jgi:hypothetical protein
VVRVGWVFLAVIDESWDKHCLSHHHWTEFCGRMFHKLTSRGLAHGLTINTRPVLDGEMLSWSLGWERIYLYIIIFMFSLFIWLVLFDSFILKRFNVCSLPTRIATDCPGGSRSNVSVRRTGGESACDNGPLIMHVMTPDKLHHCSQLHGHTQDSLGGCVQLRSMPPPLPQTSIASHWWSIIALISLRPVGTWPPRWRSIAIIC